MEDNFLFNFKHKKKTMSSSGTVTTPRDKYHYQPYQKILFNNIIKRGKHYEDIMKLKDRIDRPIPTMQAVIRSDMERHKTNKVFERRLKENISGPRGLNSQCRLELQRLRNDERWVERELLRLNLDMYKIATNPRQSQVRKASSDITTMTSSYNSSKIIRSQSHRQQSVLLPVREFEETESVTSFSTLPSVVTSCSNNPTNIDVLEKQKTTFSLLPEFPQIQTSEVRKLSTNHVTIKQPQQQQQQSHRQRQTDKSIQNQTYFPDFLLRKYSLTQLLVQNRNRTKSTTHYVDNMNKRNQEINQKLKKFLN
ncbi:unnamed protein product [Didymodactylos carnosus]|uniref:Uncharacterized protein n=1 Tax=Didymodactylos carnosus TaxID=1234261 RepID=A0A814K931_9BILA|nr:unnamed protein product [Didymodactylos carnosus]CAF1047895.1 unnamed protein product [Didymodactylos carnosus]CAF3631020.1 unnamed protein product [Didymodactylos carnosus]CAF3817630.1 unnamed protein product [Didymodactylos carnosus]